MTTIDYLKSKMRIDGDNLIVPVSLLEEMEKDLILRGYYYAAIDDMVSEHKVTYKKIDFEN